MKWFKILKNILMPISPLLKFDIIDCSPVLVNFCDDKKPVVYEGKVYQCCFIDWDDDLILKDDINGVKMFGIGFGKDILYFETLIDTIEDHPMNKIKQIEQNGVILDGNTLDLQKLINGEL